MHFFLLSYKTDTEFIFGVDLALKQGDENPVYYVQYAHACICLVFKHAGVDAAPLTSTDLATVTGPDINPQAIALVQRLTAFPDMLADTAHELVPHTVAFYLCDLTGDFHTFCNADRVLIDDGAVKRARLVLLAVTHQVLRNGLAVIDVSTP